MTGGLRLERRALEEIFAHARETAPDECCGVVVERGGRDEVWRMRNVQNELHAQDPVLHPRTARTAYALGREDIERLDAASPKVIYHSHTKTGAYFSGEDRARAMFMDEPMYPDVAYVVVSDARTPGEARAFRWHAASNDFVEVPIELV
ncbi:MAG TPA: Mov34/MPN/PAD-1 family protein [Candidatus Limnocylindria bacterium]|nr:Mov34/MPN/PAD-1 family protein [Candidatus Limnocylindria bacterium]